MTQFDYDFFISRAGADKDVSQQVEKTLIEAGYAVISQDKDFGSASFMAMMGEAIKRSRKMIAILSEVHPNQIRLQPTRQIIQPHAQTRLKTSHLLHAGAFVYCPHVQRIPDGKIMCECNLRPIRLHLRYLLHDQSALGVYTRAYTYSPTLRDII